MQAPFFYLIYTVDHKSRNHRRCASHVVRQHSLQTEMDKLSFPCEMWKNIVPTPAHQNIFLSWRTCLHTSPILTGVATRLGMHGRGQRSRHSGCDTTLQSRHFSEILPNLILFPHGTQDSGLITCGEMLVSVQQVYADEHNVGCREEHNNYSFGDKLVKPGAPLPLWGAGLHFCICCRLAGQLVEIHRLDGFRI